MRFGELLPPCAARSRRTSSSSTARLDTALAVTLVSGWFRVGSERTTGSSRTYGITTLTKRHVSVRGQRVVFRFRAKHQVLVRTTLVDDEIAEAVRSLLRYDGGARLRFDQRRRARPTSPLQG